MPPIRPLAERFWEKVDKAPGQGPWGDCWEWTAGRDPNGYGRIGLSKGHAAELGVSRTQVASRVAFLLTHGIFPPDFALHRCNNPPCVRPDHVYPGDVRQNYADSVVAGTNQWGEKNAHSILTETQVVEIRRRVAAGESPTTLAEEFGVTQPCISMVATGHRWKRAAGATGPAVRGKKGEAHSQARLTAPEVLSIRAITGKTNKQIGDLYGVSKDEVRLIRLRKHWRHI